MPNIRLSLEPVSLEIRFFAQMSAGEDGGKSILMQVINPLALITIRFAPIVAASFHHMGRRDGSIAATTAISWIGSGRMMIRAGQ